jgi:integrase
MNVYKHGLARRRILRTVHSPFASRSSKARSSLRRRRGPSNDSAGTTSRTGAQGSSGMGDPHSRRRPRVRTPHGEPFRESKMLRRVLQPAAVEAGLGRVTWHQFRHIHSSLMSDLKVPVKIAQEQLGHPSISTTLNIYTHTIAASHREAVEAVEGACSRMFSNRRMGSKARKRVSVGETGSSKDFAAIVGHYERQLLA